MQTEGLLKQSQQLAGELQTQQKELQQTNEQLEQKAQQLAERNVEVERKKPGNRTGAARARREGNRAFTDIQVQVGIPGQHVPRVADAAQQHPDPGSAADRKPRWQFDSQAGRILAHHPRRRHRPAEPHQRHPRPLEDRIGNRDRGCRGNPHLQPPGHGRSPVPPRGGQPAIGLQHRCRSQSWVAASTPTQNVCNRC